MDISDLLHSLELTIFKEFIPAVTERWISDLKRNFLTLYVPTTDGRSWTV